MSDDPQAGGTSESGGRTRRRSAKKAGETPATESGRALAALAPETGVVSSDAPAEPPTDAPATPDHVLRTKPTALFVRKPDYTDLAKLAVQLERLNE